MDAIEKARAWAKRMAQRPEVAQPAAQVPAPKWTSPTHHIAVLESASCECGAEKKVGDYRCAPCARSVRK